ncbi:MAG: L-rhamnose-proton symporter [Bryobacteraceae bacterium]|nr:L-rhamnose-proton symporter [Bryobacteraceae bacterium]
MLPGVLLAIVSGICNGLFSAPIRMIRAWKWENLWLVFILGACLAMPALLVFPTVDSLSAVLSASPSSALWAASLFGFAWGFGAILFGLSVDRLGVSLANSMVIGISSALGSFVPLLLAGAFAFNARTALLVAGVVVFVGGVSLCGRAGRMRERNETGTGFRAGSIQGYVFASGAGILSAVFNIGYSLALPISSAGQRMGLTPFTAGNVIWLVMLGAGSIPNIAFCIHLLRKNSTGKLFLEPHGLRPWIMSLLMAVLWGGSIVLYGMAAPLLGSMGPSIGWPLSLAVGLLVANLVGFLLGEWRAAGARARGTIRSGIAVLVLAIILCAASARY